MGVLAEMTASCGPIYYQCLHFAEDARATTRQGGPWLIGECSIPIPSLNYGHVRPLCTAKGDIPYVQVFALYSKSGF